MNTKRELMMKLQADLVASGQFPTCISCENWDKEQKQCKPAQMTPPPEVLVIGCTEYTQDVPF